MKMAVPQMTSLFSRTVVCLITIHLFFGSTISGRHHYSRQLYFPANQSLTINLYYESLCPDCVEFISQKLCPLWEENMSKYFKIDFVPYGNAETHISKTGKITIECQHGPRECAANVIHACALKHLSYKDSVKFVCCMEGRHNAPGSGKACAEDISPKIDYDAIQTCAEGSEGVELHYQYGQRTDDLTPKHEYVPWILFNGIYNQEDMEHAQEDLLTVVCKHLRDPKPDTCNEVY